MLARTSRVAGLVVVIFTIGACEDDRSTRPIGNAPPTASMGSAGMSSSRQPDAASPVMAGAVAANRFNQAFARTECERLFACCTAEQLDEIDLESLEACTGQGVIALRDEFIRGIPRAQLMFDEAAINASLDAIRSTTCEAGRVSWREIRRQALARVYRPLLPLGGRCDSRFQCIEGYCSSGSGQCTAYKPIGADCNPRDDEDEEACTGHCPEDTRKCMTPGKAGEACLRSGQCLGYCEAMRCVDQKPGGEACSEDEQCRSVTCEASSCAAEDDMCGSERRRR